MHNNDIIKNVIYNTRRSSKNVSIFFLFESGPLPITTKKLNNVDYDLQRPNNIDIARGHLIRNGRPAVSRIFKLSSMVKRK